MLFHWYWPFARAEEMAWAAGTVREGERVVVEVIDRPAAPAAGTSGCVTVVRDLPDVDRSVPSWRWPASRVRTYQQRESVRRRSWRRDRPDLVHLHYVNRFTDWAAPLPRPLVISMHDLAPHVPRLGRRAEQLLLARTYRRADALVVHHQRLAHRAVAELGLDARRIHVIPHQVFPVPAPVDPPTDTEPMLLAFGALRPNKGIPVLREAVSRLQGTPLRVVVAGRGDQAAERDVRAWAGEDPRVQAEVGFVPLERKHALFRDATLVVLPYTSFASQSGVLHDAYGHGRAVVVSDVGALGETVRADGTGWVVPPGDPQALAQVLTVALADPAARGRRSGAARAVARDRTPEATGRLLREVYDEVLDSPR